MWRRSLKVIKIQFLLKKPSGEQESLEYITIAEPILDKTMKVAWGNPYICEVYLSVIKQNLLAHSINSIDTLFQAVEIAKSYLQGLIKSGYTISEVESREPWQLEELSDNYLQEKIEGIKSDPKLSQEDKQKILGVLKESFSKTVLKDQLDKLIN